MSRKTPEKVIVAMTGTTEYHGSCLVEPWSITPVLVGFGMSALAFAPMSTDAEFEVPDFGLTRENALALADAIRELYGIKPDNPEEVNA